MQDVLQKIEISFGNRIEEIPTHGGNPRLKTNSFGRCARTAYNLWAIEHDPLKIGMNE